jgi:DNA modification methylase
MDYTTTDSCQKSRQLLRCWNKGHTWNFLGYRENHNFIEGPICMGKERPKDSNGKTQHPTQKPLWALRHCIELASSPGDLIYDPFSGVMSTGVAALEPGRRFIGIEIDQCYFNAGKYRMSNSLQV